jgi:hypothetical protein
MKEENIKNSFKKNALSAGLASIPAELLTLPLCTIRLNYFSSVTVNEQGKVFHPQNLWHLTKEIHSKRGLHGFFNSSPLAIISQIVSGTSKYSIYEFLKMSFSSEKQNWMMNSFLGATSGVCGVSLTQPIDTLKVMRQYCDGQVTRSYNSILKEVFSNPLKLWRGSSASLTKNIILYSLLYPTYDMFRYISDDNILVSSIITPIMITSVMQPIEFIRARIMTDKTWKLGWNPLIYYKGYLLTSIRSVIHFSITMLFIEFLKKNIHI